MKHAVSSVTRGGCYGLWQTYYLLIGSASARHDAPRERRVPHPPIGTGTPYRGVASCMWYAYRELAFALRHVEGVNLLRLPIDPPRYG